MSLPDRIEVGKQNLKQCAAFLHHSDVPESVAIAIVATTYKQLNEGRIDAHV